MTSARRELNPFGMAYSLAFLEPPVKTLSPERAERWLSRSYRRWHALAGQGYMGGVPLRLREAASLVDSDTRTMVEACTEALSTGRPVRLEHLADCAPSEPDASARLECLQRIAELEERSAEGDWRSRQERFDTGMRATVQRSIRAQERRLAKLREGTSRRAA